MAAKRRSRPTHLEDMGLEDLPEWWERPDYVQAAELNAFRNLTGVRTELDRRFPPQPCTKCKATGKITGELGGTGLGHDCDHCTGRGQVTTWGNDELKAFIVEKRQAKATDLITRVNQKKEREDNQAAVIAGIVRGYLEFFEKPAPNDMVQIVEAARLQLTMDLLQEKTEQAIEKKGISSSEIKTIMDVRKAALKSFQDIEKALGIDRNSRREETDVVQELERIKKKTREILEQRSRRLECKNCREADGAHINLGFVLWHFDGQFPFKFSAECPRCHELITMDTSEEKAKFITASGEIYKKRPDGRITRRSLTNWNPEKAHPELDWDKEEEEEPLPGTVTIETKFADGRKTTRSVPRK